MILIVHRTSVVIFAFLFLRNAGRFELEVCFLVLIVINRNGRNTNHSAQKGSDLYAT